jgi:hypothetical protein
MQELRGALDDDIAALVTPTLAPMMLAGVSVPDGAVGMLARSARLAGADKLGQRLERAIEDRAALVALTIDERAIVLSMLDDPPAELAELRAVLVNEHQWAASSRAVTPRNLAECLLSSHSPA